MIMSNGFVHLVRIVVEVGVVVFLLLSVSSNGWSTGRRSPRTVSVCHGFSVFPSSMKGPTAAIPKIPSHSSLSSHASSRNPSPTATPTTATAATTANTAGDDDEEAFLGGSEVVVTRVETEQDWIAFADLRYDEWIVPPSNSSTGNNRGSSGSSIVVPSRQAFRCATRDIYLEERPRSILVLAKRRKQQDDEHDDDDSKQEMVVMGGAEWSPYEVEASLVAPATTNDPTTSSSLSSSSFSAGYVTDVVTAVPYRNQGIGRLIMTALETLAVTSATATTSSTTTTTPIDAQRQPPKTHFILLHVHPDNASALRFYQQQLGYTTTTTTLQSSELEKMLDIGKLEQEAGTEGQILLVKKIVTE
jgi:ribosomal protein S18 acetylase RimI-like enzyme